MGFVKFLLFCFFSDIPFWSLNWLLKLLVQAGKSSLMSWSDLELTNKLKLLIHSIGRERKNSGGKRQAYYQPQVIQLNAGWIGSWFWVGKHTCW